MSCVNCRTEVNLIVLKHYEVCFDCAETIIDQTLKGDENGKKEN